LKSNTIQINNQRRKDTYMTATNRRPGTVPLRAALAILKTTATPLPHCEGGYVTAGHLAEIIERETNVTGLLEAVGEAMKEIDYHHRDMLTGEQRNHPRGSGWARVYDKLQAARDLAKGRAAIATRSVDELAATDLMASALAVRHGQTQLKLREEYQTEAETALRALLTYYQLVRKV
jgi:hypothetical protein